MTLENKIGAGQSLTEGDRKLGNFLLYSYLFFLYVRPQEYIPGLSLVPIPGMLSLLLSLWGAFHLRRPTFNSPIRIILIIGLLMLISAVGAVNTVAYKMSIKYLTEYLPQCVALFVLVDSKERILKLMNLWCLIYFCMALITIKNGGRGPGDFTNDENDAALALSMGIPFVFYSIWYMQKSTLSVYFKWLTLLFLLIAIIATDSRGGFLGAVAALLIIWWLSQNRTKRALQIALGGVIFGGIVLLMIPRTYIEDMRSIDDPEDSTRIERLHSWEIAWIMYKDNPILGVGAGNFAWNAAKYQRDTSWWVEGAKSLQGRKAHSVYFQVLADLGTIGALIYVYVMVVLPLRLYKFRKTLIKNSENKFVRLLASTLIASMGAYIVSGAFISVAYYPHMSIWIVIYAVILRYADALNKYKLSEA